jgi:glycosyltransferase involved in cell wall biosynthesis
LRGIPRKDCLLLPFLPSVGRGFHKVLSCRRVIREVERRSDAVIVQLPFAATLALLGANRPRVYHLCADIAGMARVSNAYGGYRRIPAVLAGSTFDHVQRRLVHASATRLVTNGEELRALYDHPPGRAVVSTTILDREIMSVRRQRPADAPFRVLFVGYLRMAKGIDTLIDAFNQVLDQIPNAELVIVGPDTIVDQGMSEVLKQGLSHLAQKGKVTRVGHVNFGPELFQQYADADLLALPSRSEGTPRVLVEARAFGCPVVATRVGGIPTSVSDGVDGLLVPPDDVAALRDAILRVARDRELHQRLVAGGLIRARASTVESFARAMLEEIEELVADIPVAT